MNVNKSKIMEFMKARGRRKKIEFLWEEGKEVEKVKEFKYLGYILRSDISVEEQIRYLEGKGIAKIGTVWSLGERKFKHSWKRRMRLFYAFARSAMVYGAEIWGWKKREELKRMQERYLRWCLGVDFNTSGYAVLEEVDRRRMCTGTQRRAKKLDVKMARCREESIRRECWKMWAQERRLESGMGREEIVLGKARMVKGMVEVWYTIPG